MGGRARAERQSQCYEGIPEKDFHYVRSQLGVSAGGWKLSTKPANPVSTGQPNRGSLLLELPRQAASGVAANCLKRHSGEFPADGAYSLPHERCCLAGSSQPLQINYCPETRYCI